MRAPQSNSEAGPDARPDTNPLAQEAAAREAASTAAKQVARTTLSATLVVMIALPVFAILASTAVAVIAFMRGDAALPGEYHWEGAQLDHDFASSARAASLGVQARLWLLDGTCRLQLSMAGVAPRALDLTLVHGARPDLDRRVHLLPQADGYEGPCGAVPAGLWHVELRDPRDGWGLQQDVTGSLDGAQLTARADRG